MVENIEIRIKEFELFYTLLMKNAPEGYIPWFFPCEKNGKNPSAEAILKNNSESKGSWHHESARLTKEQCIQHIRQGYNLGLSARKGDPLIIIDIDNPKLINQTPTNTLTTTSRKRVGVHAFCWDKDGSAKINLPTGDDGEIRSDNQYVLCCGSYTPFNTSKEKELEAYNKLPEEVKQDKLLGYYTVRDAETPKYITFSEVPQFFQDKQKENVEADVKVKQREENREHKQGGKYGELFNLKVSDIIGLIPKSKRQGHPLHSSDTDANFSMSSDGTLGHCWRHMVSLNAVQYLCVQSNYASCEDAGTPHKGRGFSKIKGDKLAIEAAYQEAVKCGLIKERQLKKIAIEQVITAYFNMEDLAEQLYNVNPYFFDQTGMFWLWCNQYKKWNMVDDIDILNMIKKNSNHNTISSKTRNEILEAMKQYGRSKVPLPIKNTWVQFKDTLVDINTGEEFSATPEYFVTNPIPYSLNKERFEKTPNMDRIFEEWVGKENVKKLYQIIAYCLLSDYPIHRIFCFVGAGMNGKSKFLELLRKFIGQDNCCSTELDTLLQSRFEITRLYKKLVCQMGETNFEEMNKTSQLKKLSGGDLIGFEYKGKTPFEEKNYAKIIISTNNLPTTTDKTIGFYRRWMIIDFPNTFSEKKDIIKDIPEEEYECLALKSIALLHDLLDKREFYNEGSVEERMERYEARSNFLEKFIRTYTEQDVDGYITKADFFKKFAAWSHENRHRQMSETSLGLAMKKSGIEGSTKYFDWLHEGRGGNARVWIGLKWL